MNKQDDSRYGGPTRRFVFNDVVVHVPLDLFTNRIGDGEVRIPYKINELRLIELAGIIGIERGRYVLKDHVILSIINRLRDINGRSVYY